MLKRVRDLDIEGARAEWRVPLSCDRGIAKPVVGATCVPYTYGAAHSCWYIRSRQFAIDNITSPRHARSPRRCDIFILCVVISSHVVLRHLVPHDSVRLSGLRC